MRKAGMLALGLLLGWGAAAQAQTPTATTTTSQSSGFNLVDLLFGTNHNKNYPNFPVPGQQRQSGFKVSNLIPKSIKMPGKPTIGGSVLPKNTQTAHPGFLNAFHARRLTATNR